MRVLAGVRKFLREPRMPCIIRIVEVAVSGPMYSWDRVRGSDWVEDDENVWDFWRRETNIGLHLVRFLLGEDRVKNRDPITREEIISLLLEEEESYYKCSEKNGVNVRSVSN